MRQIFATAAILAIAATPALGQEIPAGQSCGGLFCDLGIVGHKTAAAAAPAPVPGAPQAVRTEVPAVATAPAPTEPRKRIAHRRRVAPETRTAAVRPADAPPAAKPTSVAAPVAPVAARRPAAPPPSSDEPVIFMSPASQPPPLANMFRPIYR